MLKNYVISAVEGSRGHFLSEFLFNPAPVAAQEMNQDPWPHLSNQQIDGHDSVDSNKNYTTHSGRLGNIKSILPQHCIIQIQTNDYWHTAFLQWTKVGPWFMRDVKKLNTFTDQMFQYMTEINILYHQWTTHTHEQQYADYIVDFDRLDDNNYMNNLYQTINGSMPGAATMNFLKDYFELQPKFNPNILDLNDPLNTALILCRYEIQNQISNFPFALNQIEHGLDPLDYVSREDLEILDVHYRFFQ